MTLPGETKDLSGTDARSDDNNDGEDDDGPGRSRYPSVNTIP